MPKAANAYHKSTARAQRSDPARSSHTVNLLDAQTSVRSRRIVTPNKRREHDRRALPRAVAVGDEPQDDRAVHAARHRILERDHGDKEQSRELWNYACQHEQREVHYERGAMRALVS